MKFIFLISLSLIFSVALSGCPANNKKMIPKETTTELEEGNPVSQFNLGYMYDVGEIVPQDSKKAISYYEKSALQGYPKAQFNLGTMYDQGQGVPQDSAKAFSWFEKAAQQGHKGAQHNLGLMYGAGQGVAKDNQKSIFWYQKAAE